MIEHTGKMNVSVNEDGQIVIEQSPATAGGITVAIADVVLTRAESAAISRLVLQRQGLSFERVEPRAPQEAAST